jgi:alpha-N-arabinofuranosidase
MPEKTNHVNDPYGGNAVFKEEFNKRNIDPSLVFLRVPSENWYNLTDRRGWLSIKLLPQTCSGRINPAFIGHRQQNLEGSATTVMDFFPVADNEKAGLLVFQNEDHFYFLCRSAEKGGSVVQLYRSAGNPASGSAMQLIASQPLFQTQWAALQLKITAKGAAYAFYYALGNEDWHLLKDSVDAKFLSTKTAGGFVGCMYALYATSLGKPSTTKAYFDWFGCEGNDEVYKEKK